MAYSVFPPVTEDRPSPARRLTFVALGVCVAALLASLLIVGVNVWTTSLAHSAVFVPGEDDGLIPEGTVVSPSDDLPAVSRLTPALLDAVRAAAADAEADGIALEITSGWRSREYQQWMFENAIELYGSEEMARQLVASPEDSSHVTGEGVDIGPVEAQFWLIEHGARYGLCQIYGNERWHFELATVPGSACPEMLPDASASRP